MSFGLKSYILKSSERYCLILDPSTQLPLYYPNFYITTKISNKSDSIIIMVCTATWLVVFYNFLNQRKINIEDRIPTNKSFTLHEIGALKDFTQNKKDQN